MHYSYSYDAKTCADVICDECIHRFECIAYCSEPDWPWEAKTEDHEEFRIATSLDDTTGELIRNITSRIVRKYNYPWKEIYRIVSLWYVLKYRMTDLLKLFEFYHPLEIEGILTATVSSDIRSWICEKIEHGEEVEEEELEILNENEEIPDNVLVNWLIDRRIKNFTGEIRLIEETEKVEESSELDYSWFKVKKMLKEIVTLTSGQAAYQRSSEIKSMIDGNAWKYLQKAWEVRKKAKSLPPLERLKIAKAELGI